MLSFKFKDDLKLASVTGHFVVKYSCVSKENISGKTIRIWIRNTAFSMQFFGFAILEHQGNVRICDLRIIHYKFADLRIAEWHTSEISLLSIAE
jgi:hypothetical protein